MIPDCMWGGRVHVAWSRSLQHFQTALPPPQPMINHDQRHVLLAMARKISRLLAPTYSPAAAFLNPYSISRFASFTWNVKNCLSFPRSLIARVT